jgi:hypothetical protein
MVMELALEALELLAEDSLCGSGCGCTCDVFTCVNTCPAETILL